jgi:hypothetical protein
VGQTGIVIRGSGERPRVTEKAQALQDRYVQMAAWHAYRYTSSSITIKPYRLTISPPVSWLPLVERRIEDSKIPKEYEPLEPAEWLSEDVANAALRFFQNTADILPSEPYLYASKQGALVAEFTTGSGALTTIISPDSVVLFAVNAKESDKPIETTFRRGSNRVREDLRDIVRRLAGSSHGPMESTC